MLTSEQRKQVFGAAFNAFLQDLEKQTGYTIAPDIRFDKRGKAFGTYELFVVVIPLEGWEPPAPEPVEAPDEKPAV